MFRRLPRVARGVKANGSSDVHDPRPLFAYLLK